MTTVSGELPQIEVTRPSVPALLWSRPSARLGAAILLLVTAAALLSIVWTPYPVEKQGTAAPFAGPSFEHILGVDSSGRDVLSRLMGGAAIALVVGLGASVLAAVLGLFLGLVAGFYRGRVDTFVWVLTNLWYGIPDLLVALLFVVFLGRGLENIVIAIAITRWMDMARLVRGQTLSLREREFIEAARVAGSTDRDIIVRHILPNALGPILVQATYLVPQAILFEAFLSYLGLGVRPPQPSWGVMAAEGFRAILIAPHIVLAPAVAITLTLLALNWLGDALRDAVDPRVRRVA
jgi:ABC-type dipeptide/oligopeptide/nickel transport system permease subunit